MKMHQLHEQISGTLIGVFTDTIVVEGETNKIECNKHVIGGIRATDIKEFTQLTNIDERTTKYRHETIKLNKIDNYVMYKYNMKNIEYGMWYVILTAGTNNKDVIITGEAGKGKTTKTNNK